MNLRTAWLLSAWLTQVQAAIFYQASSEVILINTSCMKTLPIIIRDCAGGSPRAEVLLVDIENPSTVAGDCNRLNFSTFN